MLDSAAQRAEVERNFAVFQGLLPELLKSHSDKFALMHDGRIVEFFDSFGDAFEFGTRTFKDGHFSVQEVTDRAAFLGPFS